MPGPGGGARGGGGGRSGFSGGSRGGGHRSGGGSRGGSHRGRSGGGFHGGHPGGPGGGFPGGHPGGPRRGYPRRSPYMGGWYPRPRRYYGGCLSGVASMVLMSILLITLMICLLFSNISSIARTSSNGGGVRYDEEKLQDYADGQYARAFGSSTAYEDNLLLVFLVDETYSDYYYIAWVGDHIATDINYMLGNNQTELGQAMALCINETSYKYSLDSNLAQVMETMTKEIQDLGLETSFKCSEDHAQVRSRLRNDSELDLTEETVNTALTAFTESTGIPAAIVVEDMKDVFGTAASGSNSATVLLAVLIVVLGVILVVKFIRRRKDDTDFPSENSSVEF